MISLVSLCVSVLCLCQRLCVCVRVESGTADSEPSSSFFPLERRAQHNLGNLQDWGPPRASADLHIIVALISGHIIILAAAGAHRMQKIQNGPRDHNQLHIHSLPLIPPFGPLSTLPDCPGT